MMGVIPDTVVWSSLAPLKFIDSELKDSHKAKDLLLHKELHQLNIVRVVHCKIQGRLIKVVENIEDIIEIKPRTFPGRGNSFLTSQLIL